MAAGGPFPRALTALERGVLEVLLPEGGFPGVDTYREQLEHVQVVSGCTCGCATISLEVDREAVPEPGPPGTPLLPIEAIGPDMSDGVPDVGIILFARSGYLEMLEIFPYGGERDSDFPPPSELRATRGMPPSTA